MLIYVLKPETNSRGFQTFYGAPSHFIGIREFTPMIVTWEKWYDISSVDINHLGQYGIYQDAFGLTEFRIDKDDPQTHSREWKEVGLFMLT